MRHDLKSTGSAGPLSKDASKAPPHDVPGGRAAARRTLKVACSALSLVLSTAVLTTPDLASAQPATRGGPVIRTPGKGGLPPGLMPPGGTPGTAPGAPTRPGTPPAANPGGANPPAAGTGNPPPGAPPPQGAGTPAKPGDGGSGDLPQLKLFPKELEFQPKPPGYKVDVGMDETELPDLVRLIGQATGRRFIFSGKLRQIKATVYSPEKATVGEAYAVFLSILQTNGLTVVPHGRFLKIVESQGIVSEATPVYGPTTPVPGEDRYVTRMYRLQHVDATEVSNLLNKFKSKDGDISVYSPSNLLIITDTGSQIQRLLRIVEEIDVGGAGEQLWVEPVHYASANEVATKLNEILDLKGASGKGGKAGGAKIVADDRTNSLIVTATQPDYLRLLELVKRLDVPQSGEGEIHVLPLQYAGCKDLSQTLNSILGGSGGAGGGARPGRSSQQGPPVPGSTEDIFEGQIKVVCDEASNKLVVTSSLRDYAQLRNVIDQLDQPRRQVFIEAVIMDVNVDRSLDLGISYHGGAPIASINGAADDTFLFGGNKIIPSLTSTPSNLEALALGVKGPPLDLGVAGISVPALGVVLHAVAKDGNSNVLATPHILATDNIPAEISIGQNIPLQQNLGVGGLGGGGLGSLLGGAAGGQNASAAGLGALGLLGGGGLGGFGGVQRQDVGTKIKVTPHINDSDQVRLELNEEISEAGAAVGNLQVVPINKRTAQTTLIVRDQQTVVIGGLVRDSVVEAQTKVPVLGDLPLLGALFRQSTKTVQKTNLLLILTPYIVRNQDDLRAIFERKMQERQEFIDRYFIFSDDKDWEPPRDYSRSNGLVEDIRQSILKEEEEARLIEESKPKGARTHTPGEPIALPSLGGSGKASAGGGTVRTPDDDGGGSTNPTTPTRPRPRIQTSPKVDRTE